MTELMFLMKNKL